MKLLQTIFREHRRSVVLQAVGRRYFAAAASSAPAAPAAPSEEYLKRNYASNDSEYNTVIHSLVGQRRYYLARDVYDDMMLDGVKPERPTFHALLACSMKGARLQDAFYFRDQMKAMGLVPDVAFYNFLISTCAKCNKSDQATLILEEMKQFEVKTNGQTYICLLSAYAAAGRLERAYAIVRDMTAAGLGLNKFCYAALISAYKNKQPVANGTAAKIIELVDQSKGWSYVEHTKENFENVLMNVSDEELYNLPTAEYVRRRFGFLTKALTVYHVAFHALADLNDVEAIDTLYEMLMKDHKPDVFIGLQIMRCYLHSGDLDRGLNAFVACMNMGPPVIEVYVTFIEGAMVGYTPRGMLLAEDKLKEMASRNFFLSPKMGNDLLIVASGEKTGGFTVANLIWDMMRDRNSPPSLPAVEAYHRGLKDREIPDDDPRLFLVSRTLDDLRQKIGSLSNWTNVTEKASSLQ
ncbi:Pentatricopeptide repeat superfamily protein [Heracleum sosnowskyi]|uniref:Pentatricopeptide repeat superfamily protein n=1 Tax=Heracleum sosnowskyi TaxID=360622 RepID=A0AAD8H2U7_9APIA|nr:Pentatricopeptide repeat superfamily protein [Heracleum sosnowskyi]